MARWISPITDAGSGVAGAKRDHAATMSSGVSTHAGTRGWSPSASAMVVANDRVPSNAGDGTGPIPTAASGSSNPTVASRKRPNHPVLPLWPGVPDHQYASEAKCERSGSG
jgi:hypothetical protein